MIKHGVRAAGAGILEGKHAGFTYLQVSKAKQVLYHRELYQRGLDYIRVSYDTMSWIFLESLELNNFNLN